MKTKIVLILFLIILSINATAFAAENTTVIPGLGTLVFPPDCKVLPYQHMLDTNAVGNTLLVDDNKILRSINLAFLPIRNADRIKFKTNINALTELFNALHTSMAKRYNARILSSSPIISSSLDNEQFPVDSVKMLMDNTAVRMDSYILDGTDGLIGMIATYADCDSNYWLPQMERMIVDIRQ